jgi:hypothetical protein
MRRTAMKKMTNMMTSKPSIPRARRKITPMPVRMRTMLTMDMVQREALKHQQIRKRWALREEKDLPWPETRQVQRATIAI